MLPDRPARPVTVMVCGRAGGWLHLRFGGSGQNRIH